MTYIQYDLVIGVVLLLFALRGRSRGLVLSLCSLAAVITAFVGASYIADALTPKATEIVVPKIASILEGKIADMDLFDLGSSQDGDAAGNETASNNDNTEADQKSSGESGGSAAGLETIREAMSAWNLPSGMIDSIEAAVGSLENIGELPSLLSEAVARAAADTLLHLVIFIFSFLVILLFWRIIGHALDLVVRLPVLHFLNKTGGFVFGLSKGILFFFILAWVLRSLGNIVPDDVTEHTYLLHFFMTTDPLRYITGM